MKNLLSLLLLLVPAIGQAQFNFTTNSGAITITGYTGSGSNVVIPASTNGYPVTAIGTNAFYQETKITNVIIPNSVTSIDDAAFDFCSGLTSVTIPNSVTTIGQYAFCVCSGLTSVTIPNGVTNIGTEAFYECFGLTNVTIGNSVTTIGDAAFGYCSHLTSVTMGNSVTSISGYTFINCSDLTSVTIPNSVTNIGVSAFSSCFRLTSMTMGNSVTSISDYAFYYCASLTSVTIPNSVSVIGDYVFSECFGLTKAYFQGNAPTVDGVAGSADNTVFIGETGTAYYLPGTAGWGSTFGGWPTALWNPTPQTTDGNFGVKNNQFGFNIIGTADIPIMVEANSDLTIPNWTSLLTCTLTNGSIYFSDPQWANYPNRFYRIRSP